MKRVRINPCCGKMCVGTCSNCAFGEQANNSTGWYCTAYSMDVKANNYCNNWAQHAYR